MQIQESQKSLIIMDNFHSSTVRHLVQFMYTGDYELGDEANVLTVDGVVDEGKAISLCWLCLDAELTVRM